MRAGGLDVGSRTVKIVAVERDGSVAVSRRLETTPDLLGDLRALVEAAGCGPLVVTGYGRALAEVAFEARSVTEIKAAARGATALHPGCRTIVDIGGQDTKVISLDGSGRVTRFEMNDRCAAGAGRFLEIMAAALRFGLDEFGPAGLRGADSVTLSNLCAVFAESEVVGLMTRGHPRDDIARGVHRAIASRTAGMVRRVSLEPPVLFAGGGARNSCLVALLAEALGRPLVVPEDPQMVTAHGAALMALDGARASGAPF
jgi:(R)-2-hydroxyacyl-CoA dehydratese activating ATPase